MERGQSHLGGFVALLRSPPVPGAGLADVGLYPDAPLVHAGKSCLGADIALFRGLA